MHFSATKVVIAASEPVVALYPLIAIHEFHKLNSHILKISTCAGNTVSWMSGKWCRNCGSKKNLNVSCSNIRMLRICPCNENVPEDRPPLKEK